MEYFRIVTESGLARIRANKRLDPGPVGWDPYRPYEIVSLFRATSIEETFERNKVAIAECHGASLHTFLYVLRFNDLDANLLEPDKSQSGGWGNAYAYKGSVSSDKICVIGRCQVLSTKSGNYCMGPFELNESVI